MSEIRYFIYLIIAACMQALAMALFKMISGNEHVRKERKVRKNLILGAAIALFGISYPLYMEGLSALTLSVVQPVYSATMFLTTIILSALLLKETVGVRQMAGGSIIILGIVIVLL